jgi:hypothetical protein
LRHLCPASREKFNKQAHLVSAAVLERMRAQSLPGELNKVADQARNLREWFRSFVQKQGRGALLVGLLLERIRPRPTGH